MNICFFYFIERINQATKSLVPSCLRGFEKPHTIVAMADTSAQIQQQQPSRSRDLDKLLLRPGNLVGPRFEPGAEVLSFSFFFNSLYS